MKSKAVENRSELAAGRAHPVFPLVGCWPGLEGQIPPPPPVSSFSSSTVSFVMLTKGAVIPTWKFIDKYSVHWCNWHNTQTAPGCPASPPFTLQRFKWLWAELPETVVHSWHWKFPWSQLACRKRLSLFPPRKIMYFPATVQMPQMRQMRDLFWPTNERTFPFSARDLRFCCNKRKICMSRET